MRLAAVHDAGTRAAQRLEDDKFAELWDLTDMDALTSQIGQGETPSTAPR
jgi:hypothetical protein